ncbi:uncharacterized protein ASPGLDRAFT_1174081 [Aspergillus glaucus CBS 516.65]|uniref:Uncharacterized protein n=1 Tax=Aspergillus glaucus CBS 516.65 TaxID=1160497 RepID=A0A1L9VU20_ASPGL|nr:hypothetical protein ASPGLDRAFT_1174081 [Aspergillus glaucus CBS 516.65]OJJ87428.1 hypothetical protein ASPGLDRAFT_1174081 [Aspergillus glaucus CBS 516.65]
MAEHRTQKMQFRARPTNFPGFLYILQETRRTVIYGWSTFFVYSGITLGFYCLRRITTPEPGTSRRPIH